MADHQPIGRPGPSSKAGRPLRVAMVIQRFRPLFSGQGEQVELLCRALAARGLESTILTSAYDQPTSTEQHDGYRVVRLKSDAPRLTAPAGMTHLRAPIFGARVLTHLVRRGDFDVVHVHARTDALYTAWLWCRLRRRPLLFEMTLLGADDAAAMTQPGERCAFLRAAIFRRCHGYAAISPALAGTCREAGLDADKVRVLPQGVDVGRFHPVGDRTERRAALGLPPSAPLLMFVGSLIERKGIDLVLGAWSRIHAARADAHLVLVGRNRFAHDPSAEAFLSRQLTLLPAEARQRVHQLGVRGDVSELLPLADLFVFPSRREGFGTVMVEAMACGLPCIVAEQPGITDFIFDAAQATGVVVPQDDSRTLAAEAVALLSDPSRAQAMGREARVRAVERFDIERIAGQYVDFYADLITGLKGGHGVEH